MNTLLKVYKYAKVWVAIFLQCYSVTGYFPQVYVKTPVSIVKKQQTGEPKSIHMDAAAGFNRVKSETVKFLCRKQKEYLANDKPYVADLSFF